MSRRTLRRRGGAHPLQDRRVVVTGASSGIGRATALAVARDGGVPLLVARRADELDDARDQIVAAGGEARAYPCDLTDTAAVDELVGRLVADHPRVDVLVNNAGRSIRRPVVESFDRIHDYERTIALNYLAAVRLTLGLLPGMVERGDGHVVNVSSVGVLVSVPRFSAYVASKSALDAFGRVAAKELASSGVAVTAVHLPLVRTAMSAASGRYGSFPMMTPDDAAEIVVRAIVERPRDVKSVGWRMATVATELAPGLVDRVVRSSERKERPA